MPTTVTMPRLSDTMEAGTVIKWHVKEGDTVVSVNGQPCEALSFADASKLIEKSRLVYELKKRLYNFTPYNSKLHQHSL